METSDSDYFESADEDFQSDDEDTETVKVKSVTRKEESDEVHNINTDVAKLKDLKLTETECDAHVTVVEPKKSSDDPKIENLPKDNENNTYLVESSKIDYIQKETVKNVGPQLVKHLDNNKKQPQETTLTEEQTRVSKLVEEPSRVGVSTQENRTTEETKNITTKTEKSKSEEIKDDSVDKVDDNLWDDSELDWEATNDEENLWDNDDWEPLEEVQEEKPQFQEKAKICEEESGAGNTSWGSWGNWGVSSIISTATQSVSTLTQGLTTVLETGIGVPEPEELARINQAEKEKLKEVSAGEDTDKNTSFGLGNLVMGVSHLTKLVETTGTRVISGGLDTLETIGKKTMEVLQEGDPGLKKKRAFLKIDQDKPVLSQLLREAKEKAETENKKLAEKHFAKKAKNYETLFDDHQGLVHLEALEMLSKQCDIKLQTLLESYFDESLTDMQETMEQVKELCELPDEDEDEAANWADIKDKLTLAVSEINIPISYRKLIDTWEETEIWLGSLKLDVCDERELHQQAVETLAQLTAMAVEQFHKAGELLLVKEHRSTADEADSLVQLTTSLTSLIGLVAAKFSDKLNAKSSSSSNKEEVNGLITNVFFEAANSSSYIQDAFQLLIPVLQVGAV